MQQKLIEIILLTDFKKAEKFLIENLFPYGSLDHDTEICRRDLSCEIYNEANELLQDKNFCKDIKIKFEDRFNLNSYYRVMHSLYKLNHESNYQISQKTA